MGFPPSPRLRRGNLGTQPRVTRFRESCLQANLLAAIPRSFITRIGGNIILGDSRSS